MKKGVCFMVSLSLIALAVGALSIPLGFLALNGGAAFVSLIFALGGLVLGALGILRDPERSGLALIGIVCSVIGLIVTAVCFACSGCAICQMQAALNAIF